MPYNTKTDTYIPDFFDRIIPQEEDKEVPGINAPYLIEWENVILNATTTAAADVTYDNSGSWLSATNVKSALDELYSDMQALNCP